jgi:hypothetical protein
MLGGLRFPPEMVVAVCVSIAGVLAGCGGSGGLPREVAVQVGSNAISTATVARWVPIETYLLDSDIPKTPPPKGLIPDPPRYADCIAYEREQPAEKRHPSKPTEAQLKDKCVQRWHYLRRHTLNNLILNEWLLGEAAERGIKVSSTEAREAMETNVHHLFPHPNEFHRYLSSTGLTEADELKRMKTGLIANKVYKTVILAGKTPQLEYTAFIKKWVAKTNCAAGYVIPDCKQYKGSLPPLGAS